MSNAPPTYRVVTPTKINGRTTSGTSSLLTIWHPASISQTVEFFHMRIDAKRTNRDVNPDVFFQIMFITAENAVPGGTVITPQSLSRANAASNLVVRQMPAAPVVTGSALVNYIVPPTKSDEILLVPDTAVFLNRENNLTQPLTLQAGVAEGIVIREVVTGGNPEAHSFTMLVEWTET